MDKYQIWGPAGMVVFRGKGRHDIYATSGPSLNPSGGFFVLDFPPNGPRRD